MRFSSKLKLLGILSFAFLGYGLIFSPSSVEAAERCGIDDGDVHKYAGVIVDMKWQRAGSHTLEESTNTKVSITAHGKGASHDEGGNVVLLGPDGYKIGPNESSGRAIERTFSQINYSGCPSFFDRSDTTNVYLLGNGLDGSPDTSNNARNWGLDCDNSKLGGMRFQEFEFKGVGTPDGAGPGRWNTVHVAATPNGRMTNVRLTYIEDAPLNQTPEGNIQQMTCTLATLRAYDRRSTGAIPTRFVLKRINSSGNGTSTVIGDTLHNRAAGDYSQYAVDLSAAYTANNNRPITFILEAYDPDTNSFSEVARQNFGPNPNPCTRDDPPTFNIGVDCKGVYIHGMVERNDRGGGVRLYGSYNKKDGAGNWGSVGSFDNVRVTDGGSVFIPWPYEAYGGSEQGSRGWSMHIGAYNINKDGQDNNQAGYFSAEANGQCYQAICEVNIQNSPGLPANSVKANNPFNVDAVFTNPVSAVRVATYFHPENPFNPAKGSWSFAGQTDVPNLDLPDGVGPYQLAATDTGGGYDFPAQDFFPTAAQSIPRGTSATKTFTLTAPATVSTPSVNMYPDYNGIFGIGAECSKVTNVYQPFLLTPTAGIPTAFPNREDPERITYTAGVEQGMAPNGVEGAAYFTGAIPGTTVGASLFYYDGKNGTAPQQYIPPDLHNATFSDSYGSATYGESRGLVFTDTTPGKQFRPGNEWKPGDQFCGKSFINNSRGWIGPGNALAAVVSDARQQCQIILNYPYIRAYGGDVFGENIRAYWEEPSSSGAGSGVEFAAIAAGVVDQFSTATLRSSTPAPASGLKFAGMGANSLIRPDYFAASLKPETPDKGNGVSTVNVGGLSNGLTDNQTLIKKTSGNVTLTNGTGYNSHHAVFVEGDVVITSNITYANEGNWPNIEAIPAFDLIVKGNIYIASNVSRLDGNFVAQQNGARGGKIYTCAKPNGTTYNEDELFNNCKNNQLRVNGAFVANELKLLRTYKTLRDIPYTEPSIGNRTYKKETFGDDLAAESFRMSPEFFMARRAIKPEGSQSNGKFDYYVTLPPVL